MSNQPATSPLPTICIIHDAWHTPTHYSKLIDLLSAQGFEVACPQLLTCTSEPTNTSSFNDDLSLMYPLVFDLASEGKNIICVMHGYGGCIGTEILSDLSASQRAKNNMPGGVIHMIWISAVMPDSSMSMQAAMGGEFPDYTPLQKDDTLLLLEPDHYLFNDLGPMETAHWCEHLVRWSARASDVVCITDIPAYMVCPSTYIICGDDQLVSSQDQILIIMAARNKGAEEISEELLEAAGHDPMCSDPEAVVGIINSVATCYLEPDLGTEDDADDDADVSPDEDNEDEPQIAQTDGPADEVPPATEPASTTVRRSSTMPLFTNLEFEFNNTPQVVPAPTSPPPEPVTAQPASAEPTIVVENPPPASQPAEPVAAQPAPPQPVVVVENPPPASQPEEPVIVEQAAPSPPPEPVIVEQAPPATQPTVVDPPAPRTQPVQPVIVETVPPPLPEPMVDEPAPPASQPAVVETTAPAAEPIIVEAAPPPPPQVVVVEQPPPAPAPAEQPPQTSGTWISLASPLVAASLSIGSSEPAPEQTPAPQPPASQPTVVVATPVASATIATPPATPPLAATEPSAPVQQPAPVPVVVTTHVQPVSAPAPSTPPATVVVTAPAQPTQTVPTPPAPVVVTTQQQPAPTVTPTTDQQTQPTGVISRTPTAPILPPTPPPEPETRVVVSTTDDSAEPTVVITQSWTDPGVSTAQDQPTGAATITTSSVDDSTTAMPTTVPANSPQATTPPETPPSDPNPHPCVQEVPTNASSSDSVGGWSFAASFACARTALADIMSLSRSTSTKTSNTTVDAGNANESLMFDSKSQFEEWASDVATCGDDDEVGNLGELDPVNEEWDDNKE